MKSWIATSLATALIALAGCTTERVSTEFGALNDALKAADEKVTPLLQPSLKAARDAELTASAQAGDPWFLSDGCRVLLNDEIAVPGADCMVTNVPLGERPPVQNEGTSAQRKLATLRAYVGALELLSDASTDTAITESYSVALAAFADLGEASERQGLIDFVAKRQRASEVDAIEAVIPAAIAALRYNRMRTVVRQSNTDVRTVARELQLHLLNLRVDKGTQKDPRDLNTRLADLRAANETVLLFDTSDVVGYKSAIVALQDEHTSFTDYYKTTAVYAVGLVADVHGTLDKALQNPGSVEDVVGYLEALKSLVETVEG